MTKEVSQDSTDLFRLIAENVHDFAVFMTDLAGRVVSWNPGVGSLLGYTEGEWVGRDASIIFTPEDREQGAHLSEMETALGEGRAEDKRWHLRKDGSRFWANGFLMLLKDGRGEARGFAKIMRDDTAHRLTEERLREQLGLTETITGTLLEGIHVLDREGRITFANRAALGMLGYEAGELIGRDQHETVHSRREDGSPQPAEECPVVAVLCTGVPLRDYETVYLRKDGSLFPVLCTSAPILSDGQVSGAVMTFHDISARRRAEAELQESEERFRTLAETASDVIVTVDEESRILFINPSAEKVFGYRPEELTGQSLSLLMPEYLRHLHRDGLTRYLETGRRHISWDGVELPGLHRDGREFPLEVSFGEFSRGERHVFTGIIRDITQRKRAEEALRESEKRFRLIFNQQFQFMAILSPEGVLLDVNELPLRAAGVTREQVVGQLFWETPWWQGLPEMQAGWPARLAEAARSDAPVFSVDSYQAAGGTRVADASVTAVRDSGGRVEFFIVQASDITERKRVEEERERLLREAQEANRLKDEFLATVSHELRTPLTAILGWSHLLRGGQLEGESAAKALETIERSARAQAQLIDDLLDVSRIVTGKLRLDVVPVSPHSFIDPAVEAVRPAAEAKGVRLQKVIDTGLETVMGDPARLQQVVWNLLTNAVKFTPRGGRVQVSLERVNSRIEVAVSDTGAGISPEFLPHVFERFRQADQRTTRQHGGLGLGLSIVRHLVELHGGEVRAESAGEGTGSAFIVTLPVAPVHRRGDAEERVHPAARDALPAHECPERLDGLRVLVVDDEPDAREMVAVGLGQCGAEVVTAASAREALVALSGAKFDALISDIGMPGEDGYELIRHVRALPPAAGGRTPAVALTAYARTEDRLRSMRAGFEMHVSKPVELTELVVVLANLARRGG